MRWSRIVAVGLLAAVQLCAHAQERPVTVFAAASLKEAMDELARRFERAGGGRVLVSYAASPALARQIENGAPADIFISADLDWMDYLGKRKLVTGRLRAPICYRTGWY